MSLLISKILSASSERARRLDNFNKTFSKDLDDIIASKKNEIGSSTVTGVAALSFYEVFTLFK